MDCTNTLRQLLRWVGCVPGCLAVALALPAHADQLEQHNDLVYQYVNAQHANPLAADCAAHAVFVVGTSTLYDHIDFPDSAFDAGHASVVPWDQPFDNGKQRIKVDTIVQVEGLGFRKAEHDSPDALKFRCGYFENKMLAFSWNDPVPPAVAQSRSRSHSRSHSHAGPRSSAHSTARKSHPATKKKHR
jgi:hypothetical protein